MRKFLLIPVFLCLFFSAFSQINSSSPVRPFGTNPNYEFGIMPTNLPSGGSYGSSQHAADAYNEWKASYVQSCSGGRKRVIFDNPNQTVSEGIAYGMLLAAYAGDKPLLDELWAFYKSHFGTNDVMDWRTNGCNSDQSGGATDAELDAALALIVADVQWPTATSPYDYSVEANALLVEIRTLEIHNTSYQTINGDLWGFGNTCRNPAYQSPAYYKVYDQFAPHSIWNNAVTASYNLINNNVNPSSGLVSDWCDNNGNPNNCNGGDATKKYGFDAIRHPWRMGTDVLWHNDAQGEAICDDIAAWTQSKGISNLRIPIRQDGTGTGNYKNPGALGTWAVAVMGSDDGAFQSHLNAMYTETVNTKDNIQGSYPTGYYGNTLRVLSLFVMTGNFWDPYSITCTQPDLGADKSLCGTPSVTLDPNVPTGGGKTFDWNTGATSTTLNATTAGTYYVTIDSAGCVRSDTVQVFSGNAVADYSFNKSFLTVDFFDESTGESPANLTYTWNFGDGSPTSGTQNPSHTFGSPGAYNVCLTVQNACGTDQVCKTVAVGSSGFGGWFDDFNNATVEWAFGAGSMALSENCSDLVVDVTNVGNWDLFGIIPNDGPSEDHQDLGEFPYVIFKAKSDVPVDVRVDLEDGNGASTDANPHIVSLTSTYQVFTLDYRGRFENLYGTCGTCPGDLDSTDIRQLNFFPEAGTSGWSGTITLDWVIIGDTIINPPTVDLGADQSLCSGSVNLDAGWCGADNYTWNTGATTQTINVTTAGTYWVTVSNYGGSTTDTIEIFGNTAPTASFSDVVTGADVDFTDFSTGNIVSWSWDFDDGSPLNTAQNPSHTYASDGTYNVCLTVTDACSNTDQICQDVDICSSGSPTAAFSATPAALDVSFTNTSSNATSYSWDFDDGSPASTATNPNHTYATGGTYNVCLTATNACASEVICTDVTVNCTAPTAGFTSSSTNLDASFTNTSTGATSYSWDFGDASSTSSATNPNHTYASANTYNVCLTATNACGNDVSCANVVITCPVPTASYTSSSTGLDASFTNTSTSSGTTTYSWDFDDGSPASTAANPNHTYATGGTYNVCLTTTNDCGSDVSCSNVVITCTAPTASFTSVSTNYDATFTNTSSGATSYSWDFGDGSPTSGTTSPTHTYATENTFNVCLTATNVCGNDVSCSNITITCPEPVAGFTFSETGGSVTFTDASTGTVDSYEWDFDDGAATSSAASPSYFYATPATYKVCQTVTNACGEDSTCQFVTASVSSIDESTLDQLIDVYPNPTVGSITIEGKIPGSEAISIEVSNLLGETLYATSLGSVNNFSEKIDLTNVAQGIYIVLIKVGEQRIFKKIIKE